MQSAGRRDKSITGLLVLVFLAALLARIANIVLLPISVEYLTVEDAIIYWDGAKVLLDHGVFGRFTGTGIMPETERTPGYIYFLAGLRRVFSDSLVGILLAQAVLDSLTCVLNAVIGDLLKHQHPIMGQVWIVVPQSGYKVVGLRIGADHQRAGHAVFHMSGSCAMLMCMIPMRSRQVIGRQPVAIFPFPPAVDIWH